MSLLFMVFTPLFICLSNTAWDHEGIDHWKIEPFTEEDAKGNTLVEETSFSIMFPKYREAYLREFWPHVTRSLKKHVGFPPASLTVVLDFFLRPCTSGRLSFYLLIEANTLASLISPTAHQLRAGFGRGYYDGEDHAQDV